MKSLTKEEIISRLTFFNEKVDELNNSNFIKKWDSQKILWNTLTFEQSWSDLYPSEDEVKAFILTWRFLYNKTDKISIRQLSELYESELIDNELLNEFESYRNMLNTVLDLNFRSNNITNRQILDAFVFGNYSHSANKKKRKLYLDLTINDSKRRISYASFYSIMNNYLKTANLIKKLNHRCIQEISAT